ncbi:MAG: hypothetical protein LBT59_01105 [Clostridiales bacterium]|jgi:uncharacterized phage-associated protein|nr:hypothetical protein [Clostridiales bacterium]
MDYTLSIYDVAGYLIHHQPYDMTGKRLHLLCYFAQAISLACFDIPIFPEDFVAGAFYPICPELYEKHCEVPYLEDGFFGDFQPDKFNADQVEVLSEVLSRFNDTDNVDLATSANSSCPYIDARVDVPFDERGNVINKHAMLEYYAGIIQITFVP